MKKGENMKNETKTAIMKHIKNYLYLTIFAGSILSAYVFGVIHGEQSVPDFMEIDDLISDESYNFQVMRDLFTPMYNDSVTVENAEYDDGFCFWVNHTRVLNSYFFDNMKVYHVRIPTWGRIELIKEQR